VVELPSLSFPPTGAKPSGRRGRHLEGSSLTSIELGTISETGCNLASGNRISCRFESLVSSADAGKPPSLQLPVAQPDNGSHFGSGSGPPTPLSSSRPGRVARTRHLWVRGAHTMQTPLLGCVEVVEMQDTQRPAATTAATRGTQLWWPPPSPNPALLHADNPTSNTPP
jgi:hypothetical protein